jgi:hypothetical protein
MDPRNFAINDATTALEEPEPRPTRAVSNRVNWESLEQLA